MAQDLRDLMKKEPGRVPLMKEGHEERFGKKLDDALGRRKRFPSRTWLIAASLVVIFGTATFLLLTLNKDIPRETIVNRQPADTTESSRLSLGDLSPDLHKIEQYYVANINLELSDLEVSDDNKAVVDSFMERLAELNREYEDLNNELNTVGPNDQTISALINNLQLRLQLLQKLKQKLNSLKSTENETQSSLSI